MQSGGGAGGPGRTPAAAAPGRPSSSSSASPSSSSSAASAPTHLGFEMIQQQQQLTLRQSLQQQQLQQQKPLRNSEGDPYRFSGLHGVISGNNFPSSSGTTPVSQTLRNFNDAHHPHSSPQLREGSQNKGQVVEQQLQNPIQQAYLQLAFQTAQLQKSHGNLLVQQQGKIGMVGPSGRDQDMHMNNLRVQDLARQVANQAQQSIPSKLAEHMGSGEKHKEQSRTSFEQRNELKTPQTVIGQIAPTNILRPMQSLQAQANTENIANNQLMMAQLQAMQAWAMERNIDLSHPSSANLIAQVWQSARLAAMQKSNEISTTEHQSCLPSSKQQVLSSPGGSENSAHGNSLSDHSVQAGTLKNRQTFPSGALSGAGSSSTLLNSSNVQMQQQLAVQNKENQNERVARPPLANGNGGIIMGPPQSSGSTSQISEHSNAKREFAGIQTLPMQYYGQSKQINQPMSQSAVPSNDLIGTQFPSQGGLAQVSQQNIGFTKQQLHVLKAQILAFRRIKRGDRKLPQEVLDAITPPPLTLQPHQAFLSPGIANHERMVAKNVKEHVSDAETVEKAPVLASSGKGHDLSKEPFNGEEKATSVRHSEPVMDPAKEPAQIASVRNVEQPSLVSVKSEQDVGQESQKISIKSDYNAEKAKGIPVQHAPNDAGQIIKPASMSNAAVSKDVATRKYHGPLFDFPFFTRKPELFGSTAANSSSNLMLAYDVKDLLFEEGIEILNKKRTENLRKISGLLTVNLERKRILPDLVLRLQIEEKKLRLLDLQARLRNEVDQQQQEIMAMPDRPYRKFVKQCERQRMELMRQVQQLQKTTREKQLKSIFQWRKKLLEAHWAIRDARTTRNRGVAKYHERMLREFSKKKDDDRNKRMEALKNNDVDRYREMLLEQQTSIPGDAAQRYAVLSSFLSQTEEYLHKLGGKITAAKNHQEVVEAANAAAAAAQSQGLSEEEVKAAAACAGEEVMIRNRFSEMNAPKDSSSANKYYNLAHAVNERVVRQPSMLRAGTLRDYQLVGLQWMLSLYNNKLNGILADEMGLGKTVQVMALIAYLMEFKGNYGPHLIIVPNAVLVNWKSELHNWLPTVSCIFYVGGKDQRSRLFSHEVCAMKFNVLVTTYEFVMYDRSRLSKVDWKYIIIDEAQRMKDRESVLARDLDRYRCQRRLLLTGTPLQNDLKELWSLLNLLLPEVFDNRKAFHDWFSKPFQRDGPSHSSEEDDWLETEKKVIIIHRLHQILEPFMLRRRVEDVEGSLPRKDSIVLRCRMSAIQGAIYDWIKSTGTIRVDPEDELRRAKKNPMYQVKAYKNLNNKCMELRKACNHPLLNYPYFNNYSKDFLVRSCGKLWILDRILIKLQRAGHRVLLFSTMTKLLDILEEYLQWRRLVYRRIDGTTSLEDREAAIVDFNSPGSDCFIFLLSIRAAGRGLNLQSADTVVIYDPDPNPQNEEQAVARAHRIGQQREVKVIYMEAVVDKMSSYQKEDDLRNGGTGDLEDDLAGKDRYMGSIESLIRNNIQQYKIDMADEVINAGRFDQRTTHEERRMTLETLLHDEERYQETVHDVPSMQEVNRMIARREEEVELFDQMDDDFDWTGDMMKHNQVPKWLRAGSREVNAVIANLAKKPSKNILAENIELESGEIYSGTSPGKIERRRGRPRGPTINKRHSVYMELDDEDGEDSDASSEERDIYSFHEEEGDIGEFEEEESNGALDVQPNNRYSSEEQGLACDGSGYDMPQTREGHRNAHMVEDAGSSGSSSGSRRLREPATPSVSSQKFGFLSTLDARPGHPSKRMQEELEEGEIAVSGDSQMDLHQSGSWINEREDGEDEQVLQPSVKGKRSRRVRPRYTVESLEEKCSNERIFSQRGSQLPMQVDHDYDMQFKTDSELETFSEPASDRHDANATIKERRNLPSRKASNVSIPKFSRTRHTPGSTEDASGYSRESWNTKASNTGDPSLAGTKMSDSTQRKCKNVISKLQKRIDKEGYELVPLLSDLWKKNQNANLMSTATVASNIVDLRRIDQRVDNLEYNGVLDFIADVQLLLQNVVQFYKYSYEVKYEARKLHDMFFDIMKIAFPDTDFREARNAFIIPSSGGSGSAVSPKLAVSSSQSKRHKTVVEVKPDQGPIKSASRGPVPLDEDGRTRGYTSKPQKESRPASGSCGELAAPELSPLLTHPGDLVICKKRRKDRDKSAVKRTGPIRPPGPGPVGPVSATNAGQAGPIPPPSANRTQRIPEQRGAHPHPAQQPSRPNLWAQQPAQPAVGGPGGPPGMNEVQWARPVKKMRTDAGKRRPSHL